MTHSPHFIYGYMISDIWLRTTGIEETRAVALWTTHADQQIATCFYMASHIMRGVGVGHKM